MQLRNAVSFGVSFVVWWVIFIGCMAGQFGSTALQLSAAWVAAWCMVLVTAFAALRRVRQAGVSRPFLQFVAAGFLLDKSWAGLVLLPGLALAIALAAH